MITNTRFKALDAVAFGGMFVFGIVMALLGACMPALADRLRLGLTDAGTLFLVTNASMLVASMLVGPVMDRLGMKLPLALGSALVAVALAGIASAATFARLLAAVSCLGFGGGAINASANTLVADLHDDPETKAGALNLLGVFFGIGALLLPFSVGALLARVGLAGVLLVAAALSALTAVTTAAARFPAPKQAHGWPLADAGRFVRMPMVVAMALLLFFESGNEFVLGGYIVTFFTRTLGVAIAPASYLLAVYWTAMMVARLALGGGLVGRVGPRRIVLMSALLASSGSLLLAVARSAPVAAAGVVVTGVAFAGIFPTTLGVAGARFPRHSGTVFGILFTVALTGGMTMPWLAGNVGEWIGLRVVFLLVAANFLAIAALNAVAHRAARTSASSLHATPI